MKLSAAGKIVLILTIAAYLFLLVQGILTLRLFLSRYIFFTVVSGSMEPALKTGCLIAIKRDNHSIYRPGDIITYEDNGRYITHRVIDTIYDGRFLYRTRGDANPLPDPQLIPHNSVIGSVVFVVPPFVKSLRQFFRSRFCLLLLIIPLPLIRLKREKRSRHITPKKKRKYADADYSLLRNTKRR